MVILLFGLARRLFLSAGQQRLQAPKAPDASQYDGNSADSEPVEIKIEGDVHIPLLHNIQTRKPATTPVRPMR
jgi:hypothetical protein